MGFLTDKMSFNKRFDIPTSKSSTFFKGDLLKIIQKYPMLWGWLLDMSVPDTRTENATTLKLANTYGLPDNPIKPSPEIANHVRLDDVGVLKYLHDHNYFPRDQNSLHFVYHLHQDFINSQNSLFNTNAELAQLRQVLQQRNSYINKLQNVIQQYERPVQTEPLTMFQKRQQGNIYNQNHNIVNGFNNGANIISDWDGSAQRFSDQLAEHNARIFYGNLGRGGL